MRRALVAGNWKMNGSRDLCRALADEVAAGAVADVDMVVCPPFPYLSLVGECLVDSPVALGAQDMAAHEPGAHTGDVAGEMLLDTGCTMVILGHSERRHGEAESDTLVASKVHRALTLGLVPIICVGETLQQREADQTTAVVLRQLDAVHTICGAAQMSQAVLAYEPVWAIGTGLTATPEQAQEVHASLRERLNELGVNAASLRLLYGGSVKPENAKELFSMPDIDGGLIGGAALKASDFLAICHAAGS